jgi:hypothetical protein
MNIYSLYYSKWIAGDYRPNITAYYSIEWNGFHMPPHRHNQVEIMYVFGGTCLIDAMGKSCTLEKGDFILIDAGVPHGLEVGRDLKCRMLNIEFTFVGGRASTPTIRQLSEEVGSFALLLRDKPPFLLARDYYDLHSPLKNIIMELDDRKNGTLMLAELYMSEILIKLSRAYDDSRTKSPEGEGKANSSHRVKAKIIFVSEYSFSPDDIQVFFQAIFMNTAIVNNIKHT